MPENSELQYDIETEQAVLGAMLLDYTSVPSALSLITPDDFHRKIHQSLMRIIQMLYERGEGVDVISVRNALRKQDLLDAIGGAEYLNELVSEVVSSANIRVHAQILKNLAQRRTLTATLEKALQQARGASEGTEAIVDTIQRTFDVLRGNETAKSTLHVSEAIENFDGSLERVASGEMGIIPTKLLDVDFHLDGVEGGDLCVVGARPGQGKTAFMNYLVQTWSANIPCLAFEIEMSEKAYLRRVLSYTSGIRSRLMRKGLSHIDLEQVRDSYPKLAVLNQYYNFNSAPTIGEILAISRSFHREQKRQVIIFVDYLQLVRSAKRAEKRYLEVGEITKSLKSLAKDLDSPVVLFAQLRRFTDGQANRRPNMELLRESGDIEQDADEILLLHNPSAMGAETFEDGTVATNKMDILIEKARNAERGIARIFFDMSVMRIANLTIPTN